MKRTALLITVIIATVAVAGSIYIFTLSRPVKNQNHEILFTVEKGSTLNYIASDLYVKKLIKSELFLKIYGRITGKQNQLKSGSFILNQNMTAMEILETLINGDQVLTKITIPEGQTMSAIAEKFDLLRITDKEDFLEAATDPDLMKELGIPAKTAEGFLYPDTYMFPVNYPASKVLSHLVNTFFLKLAEIEPDYKTMKSDTLLNHVIMASIVEREYRLKEEAPKIAAAFWNRYKTDYWLQSCATVVYVLTEILGRDNPQGAITIQDVRIQNPYNTYQNKGLPPGPISNPGYVALNASFHPADISSRFFVLIDEATGRHHFSDTYEEHLQAIEQLGAYNNQYSIK